MKNLLTKILFVSLLLSAVIPSGVQAISFIIEDAKELTKKLGAVGVGGVGGFAVGGVVGFAVGEDSIEGLEAVATAVIGAGVGLVAGSGIGIAALKKMEKRRTREIITTGIGGSLGTALALSMVIIKQELFNTKAILSLLIGGTVGATVLEQIEKMLSASSFT